MSLADVTVFAGRLLRRHVMGRADHLTGIGQRGRPDRAGDAEIGHLHRPVRTDDEVGRLHVPMDHAGPVRGVERLSGLAQDRQLGCGRQGWLLDEELRKRQARDQLHHQIGDFAGLAVVVDRRDSRMAETGRVPSFRPEPLDERRCGPQLVLEDLDRDSPGQQEVGPFPDLAHPAHGDLSCQHIAATEYLVALGPHVLYVPFAGRR